MNHTSKRVRANRIAPWDVFVTVAISIIAMAMGVGLFMQFEAEFPFALLAAFFTYVGLLTAHVSVKRAQRVRELEGEIAHLHRALEQVTATQQPAVGEPRPASDPSALASTATGSQTTGFPPTLAPPHPSERFFPGPDAFEPPAPILSSLGYPTLSFEQRSEPRGSEHALAPDAERGERVAVSAPGITASLAQPREPALGSQPDQSPMRDASDPTAPAIEVSSPEVVDESARAAVAHEPAVGAVGFDTMQVLIQQLAAQLVAPNPPVIEGSDSESEEVASAETSSPGSSGPAAYADAQVAIDQSVAMLRAASENLRHEPDAADGSRAPDRPATSDAAPGAPPRLVPAPNQPPSPYSRLALIAEALSSERIQVLLEPILDLGVRRARHFEVSVRLHSPEGEEIDIAARTSSAVESGLMARIDAARLARTAHVAERLRARGSEASLFARLTGHSLADDGFRATAAEVLAGEAPVASGLVIAFAQNDVRSFTAAHWDAVATMAELGLQFSVEEITDLDMDFEELVSRGVHFVKLDAEIFLRGLPTPGGAIPAADLCNWFSGLGLSLIVGRIDDEDALARIMESGAPLGQGPLFGDPRPVAVDSRPSRAVVA